MNPWLVCLEGRFDWNIGRKRQFVEVNTRSGSGSRPLESLGQPVTDQISCVSPPRRDKSFICQIDNKISIRVHEWAVASWTIETQLTVIALQFS